MDTKEGVFVRVVGGSSPSIYICEDSWTRSEIQADTDFWLVLREYTPDNVEGSLQNRKTGQIIAMVTGYGEEAVYSIIWQNYFDQLYPDAGTKFALQRLKMLEYSKELTLVFFINGEALFREDGRFLFVSTKTPIGEFLRRAYEDETIPFFEAERQSNGLVAVTGFRTTFKSTVAENKIREVLTQWLMTTPTARVCV